MEELLQGFNVALSLNNFSYCTLGVLLGTAVGVLPGIGSLAAVSMLLPFSFYLDPAAALIMLAGVYYGAEYGGSTAAILLNLPGTSSSAVTCLEGYQMCKQGRGGVALCITALASFIGGTLGIVMLMAMTPVMITFAFSFTAPEYFAAILLALIAVGSIASGSPLKGLAMVVIGVLIGTIGLDVISGASRFNFGLLQLFNGINVVAMSMGLFGVAEVIASIRATAGMPMVSKVSLRSMIPTGEDIRRSTMPTLRGFAIGGATGPVPGIGPTVAAFASYAFEKRLAEDPSRFGHGAIEGVAGPESANNAAAQTAFIPMLAMGIPGTATTALMLSALIVHGIEPGPRLMTEHPDIFWGVVASFWIGNILLLILNIPLIGLWVNMLRIPYRFLYPMILTFICLGVYSVNYSTFDVWLVLVIGIVGYGMRLLDFEPAPLLIGYILGPILEENFRRTMIVSYGDVFAMFQRPISGTLLAMGGLLLVITLYSNFRGRKKVSAEDASES
ncbi:hypothetical protein FACS1894158_05510 [Betaproteobacteria bacterium]|nr:hypothetical protein FACS1894158_05510 [Betaproteobacteria bacterium]